MAAVYAALMLHKYRKTGSGTGKCTAQRLILRGKR